MRLLISALLVAGALLAQGGGPRRAFVAGGEFIGPPGQPRLAEIKAYLSLTDSQVQALQQLQKQESDSVRPIFTQMQQKQEALHDALSKSKDAASIGQMMLDIEVLRKQIQDINKKSHDQAVISLTADQKNKLAKLEEATKLQSTIHQAVGLSLLDLPVPSEGPAFMIHAPGPEHMQVRFIQRHAQ